VGRFSGIPYQDRTDAQKAQTQWGKALGLLSRSDWSAAIVRAVTATEISLNLAIRAEYNARQDLSFAEVNRHLLIANGFRGKLSLLKDLFDDEGKRFAEQIGQSISDAANKRNRIVHSGEFCDEQEARDYVESCRIFVNDLIGRYEPHFLITVDAINPDEDSGA
tara:strand:- start:3736 stop:4227 length:492 start_codon:yes stop_codon:yes gene_type:complete